MNDELHIGNLISKELAGEITEAEWAELQSWIAARSANAELFDRVKTVLEEPENHPFREFDPEEGWQDLMKRRRKPLRTIIIRIAVAASLLGAVVWLGTRQHENKITIRKQGIVLTGPHGQEVVINNNADTTFRIGNGNANVQPGMLSFEDNIKEAPIEQFTLRVPVENRYQLRLPDGSQLWLNAGSTVRFPNRFAANERRISIQGEAYLEVAQESAHPFVVETAGMNVTVLGTAFNIRAYGDVNTKKVSLVSGSVKVTTDAKEVTLKPGQEVGSTFQVATADMEATLAWKDGLFIFRGESLQSIMEDIAHWYGVNVVYQGQLPADNRLSVKTERNIPLNQLLSMLSATGSASFKIERDRVIVLPYNGEISQ
ncbi:FecR family protein [Chitinophaga sp. YR573]|uniref:FecR family protein n=1 Tax=Chitinophaga sp. YR573 TaxID=1881040 RepID=UPI0008B549C5|nr:FecR domain-containing protein [Chitinophaga sp. YR573]SEW24934.1 FecR family protein [Chitinophaga sp. YR573]